MTIQHNVSLKTYNTFGIDQTCRYFISLNELEQVPAVINFAREQMLDVLILGGGSNLLLTKNYEGLVIQNCLKGIAISQENEHEVVVKAAAGEVWHELVMWCIARGYAGLENLSLIPGCVGAAPMQNIGAYGVEIKDTFHELTALHLQSGEQHTFTLAECKFGYRESVFKNELKGKYLITSVSFKLSKTPQFKTTYGAIQQELDKMSVKDLSIKAISDAVIAIRSSKLPNPKEIGNAGSFFKNPVVGEELAETIKKNYPDAPVYPVGNGTVKLAAGWLIEQCGWKGKTIDGRYGVHKNQALVLVNYSNATGQEIWELSANILQDVHEKFGVMLEREVNIL